ncbi:MAG TPA: hypothetical protein VGY77_08055 [Gemmataceae bacterium]|jgi:hypothetical protein|nr:hypothetical protein [Gemmataceae bacterium]
MDNTQINTDPRVLIDALDPKTIRAELSELENRQRALRVLLRAALARQRRAKPPSGKEVGRE